LHTYHVLCFTYSVSEQFDVFVFRLAAKFNLSHRISDIRQFIIAYPYLAYG